MTISFGCITSVRLEPDTTYSRPAREQSPELHARLEHLRLRGALRDPQQAGDLLVIEPFDVVQHERLATPGGKLFDRALEIEARQRRLPRRHRFERSGGVERVGDSAHLRAAAADKVQTVIDRQAIQPRTDRRIALEAAELT